MAHLALVLFQFQIFKLNYFTMVLQTDETLERFFIDFLDPSSVHDLLAELEKDAIVLGESIDLPKSVHPIGS